MKLKLLLVAVGIVIFTDINALDFFAKIRNESDNIITINTVHFNHADPCETQKDINTTLVLGEEYPMDKLQSGACWLAIPSGVTWTTKDGQSHYRDWTNSDGSTFKIK